MRVTLDAAILVRVYASPSGPAFRLASQLDAPEHRIVLSPYIVDEARRVLAYPRFQARYKLTPSKIEERIEQVSRFAQFVEPAVGPPVILKDPKDDPVLYTAVAGKADVLCTLDLHFYEPDVLAFCERRGIRVMKDVDLLNELLLDQSGPRA